jgi:hypothetical protein
MTMNVKKNSTLFISFACYQENMVALLCALQSVDSRKL